MEAYLRRNAMLLLLLYWGSACQTNEPVIDWSQEEGYTPLTDQSPSDSLVLTIGDEAFAEREETIEELADRLGLSTALRSPFAFHLHAAETNDGRFVGYLPGLSSNSFDDGTRQWVFQSGRYLFRFQESKTHRFVSIIEKFSERRLVDSEGQSFTIADQSSARLYIEDEKIVDEAIGLKRERLTFTQKVNNLSATYPDLSLSAGTVAVTDYRYDTVVDDSIDDGLINEKRARVLLVLYEKQEGQ